MPKTKEQMQLIVLGAIIGGGALVAGVYFGLAPMISSIKDNKRQCAELQEKLDKADKYIRNRDAFSRQFAEGTAQVVAAYGQIPMPRLKINYLLGMKEYIRECAREIAVELDTIVDNSVTDLGEGGKFKIYSVRVSTKSGLSGMAKLARQLEEKNPLAVVSSVVVNIREDEPRRHGVLMMVSWLIWADPEKRADEFLAKAPADKGKQP